ncbi:hypothetical protein [Streptomyces sp. NPDC048659]|uniref:hypothetical protein n=1 Tax=Streptomyces sp. NPDC048659 TaxID=3155489 RepID=UPI0034269927
MKRVKRPGTAAGPMAAGLMAAGPMAAGPMAAALLASAGWLVATGGQAAAVAAAAPEPPLVVSAADWSGKGQASTATCPEGTSLVGGGYDSLPYANGFGNPLDFVDTNTPAKNEPNTWVVKLHSGRASAYALCSRQSATPPVVVASSDWSGKGQASTATCPEGTSLVGGGYDSLPYANGAGNPVDSVDTSAPAKNEPNAWVTRLHSGKASSYALCDPASATVPAVVTSDGWSADKGLSRATCPEGTSLIGGGYDSLPYANGFGNPLDSLDAFAPAADQPNTWVARMHRGKVSAYALCSPSSAVAPTVVASGWSAKKETAKATCPEGTVLAGSGYDSQPYANGFNEPLDFMDTFAPTRDEPNTWSVRMHSGQSASYVMCTA